MIEDDISRCSNAEIVVTVSCLIRATEPSDKSLSTYSKKAPEQFRISWWYAAQALGD